MISLLHNLFLGLLILLLHVLLKDRQQSAWSKDLWHQFRDPLHLEMLLPQLVLELYLSIIMVAEYQL